MSKKKKDKDKAAQSEVEEAFDGKVTEPPAETPDAPVVEGPDMEALEAPPGFEAGTAASGGRTTPERFRVRVATRAEVNDFLQRQWPGIARLNRGKALVRVVVIDPPTGQEPTFDKLPEGKEEGEVIALCTLRYALSADGTVTGPFFGRDESWSQFQQARNLDIAALEKAAKGVDKDAGNDKGMQFLRGLLKKANISPFPQAGRGVGTYRMVAGPIVGDVYAFARKYASWFEAKLTKLPVPSRQTADVS
jgi:hypothetical protein